MTVPLQTIFRMVEAAWNITGETPAEKSVPMSTLPRQCTCVFSRRREDSVPLPNMSMPSAEKVIPLPEITPGDDTWISCPEIFPLPDGENASPFRTIFPSPSMAPSTCSVPEPYTSNRGAILSSETALFMLFMESKPFSSMTRDAPSPMTRLPADSTQFSWETGSYSIPFL